MPSPPIAVFAQLPTLSLLALHLLHHPPSRFLRALAASFTPSCRLDVLEAHCPHHDRFVCVGFSFSIPLSVPSTPHLSFFYLLPESSFPTSIGPQWVKGSFSFSLHIHIFLPSLLWSCRHKWITQPLRRGPSADPTIFPI